ncbi:MAG: tRNA (N6-threonylcarbamoyladenosine(37)-N6)-methyltransferase TrmO [Myxococcota bacterium]|nr:tRNA (N6-threonylcarbamoyladenosine(37)-N6)-methyltransferase TrmO [Myxococcota bacterium]
MQIIGHIHTPFGEAAGGPIQPAYAQGAEGRVIVDEPFAAALADLEGFERIWLIFLMDRAAPFRPRVVPFRDTRERGLFATRAPCRPNPLGLSVVRLLAREGNTLRVADVDMLDGTPLLDIKPYVPAFDAHPTSRAGWLDAAGTARELADGRFVPGPALQPDGSVVLTLAGHCLQTAARHAHRTLAAALLADEEPLPGTTEALELLTVFLTETDFATLRAAHPELDGRGRARVRLFRDARGVLGWETLAALVP